MKLLIVHFILIIEIVLTSFSTSYAQVSRTELDEIALAFDQAFKASLQKHAQDLVINEPLPIKNFDWFESPIQSASYVQDTRNEVVVHILTIMGGLLKIKGVTQDTAVLILCHELGHGIGGAPFKSKNGFVDHESSTEAQADYFSTLDCAPKIWQKLHPEKLVLSAPDQGRCSGLAALDLDGLEAVNNCRRSFEAMKGYIEYQRVVFHLLAPSQFEKFDSIPATRLSNDIDFYPNPQCRLDTLVHGALRMARPTCWFPVASYP